MVEELNGRRWRRGNTTDVFNGRINANVDNGQIFDGNNVLLLSDPKETYSSNGDFTNDNPCYI